MLSEHPVLVTAFNPFGGAERNASQAVLELLPERVAVPGARDAEGGEVALTRVVIPTEFDRGARELIEAIDQTDPRAVISLGEAGGRRALTPERVAINIDDARIPDNIGAQPLNVPIDEDGPAAYFSTLPLAAMIGAMRGVVAHAELSNSAGTFVCNHIMYVGLHHLARTGRAEIPAGFIHVPDLETVNLTQAAEALVAGIVALLRDDDTQGADLGAGVETGALS